MCCCVFVCFVGVLVLVCGCCLVCVSYVLLWFVVCDVVLLACRLLCLDVVGVFFVRYLRGVLLRTFFVLLLWLFCDWLCECFMFLVVGCCVLVVGVFVVCDLFCFCVFGVLGSLVGVFGFLGCELCFVFLCVSCCWFGGRCACWFVY